MIMKGGRIAGSMDGSIMWHAARVAQKMGNGIGAMGFGMAMLLTVSSAEIGKNSRGGYQMFNLIGATSVQVTVSYCGYSVTIPQGAECRRDFHASGTNEWFLTNKGLHICQTDCKSLFNHDRNYRFLFVPDEAEVTLS